jgi:hypothetical protein
MSYIIGNDMKLHILILPKKTKQVTKKNLNQNNFK